MVIQPMYGSKEDSMNNNAIQPHDGEVGYPTNPHTHIGKVPEMAMLRKKRKSILFSRWRE